MAQFRLRRSRMAALGLAILVAAVSFVLLTAAAQTSRLQVHGTLKSNYRAAYDVLVRPKASATFIEARAGLVRPNFLSGIFGGITLGQYDEIKRIPGVNVAAPIANIGYVLPFARLGIPLNRFLSKAPFQLYRLRGRWIAQDGTSSYPATVNGYVYFTRRDEFVNPLREVVPGRGEPLSVCSPFDSQAVPYGPFGGAGYLTCYSGRSPGSGNANAPQSNGSLTVNQVGSEFDAYFPLLLAAIDPVQEARLLHLDHAVIAGRYLKKSDRPIFRHTFGSSGYRFIPMIASTKTFLGEHLELTIERLRLPPRLNVPAMLASSRAHRVVTRLRGQVIGRRFVAAQRLYDALVGPGRNEAIITQSYWTTSSTRYHSGSQKRLAPIVVRNPLSVWKSTYYGENGGFQPAPPDNRDVQFRRLTPHIASNTFVGNIASNPAFEIVGRYDPSRLPGFSPLSQVPLETYYPPRLEAADARSKRILRGLPLLPTQNLGDYIAQPPLLLTTLEGMKPFLNQKFFKGANPTAPISAIRVRVKGVTGPDKLSEARVRSVAQQIHEKTGLQVDITAGSSPKPLLVDLPKGGFGRPALLLREGWSKKGASITFLRAVDRKSLALFALILVVCAFFLGNGALASVRARRAEMGTLLTLGWSNSTLFAAILGELAIVGLVAGVAGTLLAAILVPAFSLALPLWRVVLVLPLAVGLALAAGFLPAWRASRGSPLDAIRPPVTGETRSGRAQRLVGLALINLLRLPGRMLVGASGLVIGVAALTVLIGIQRAFQGVLIDTVLGNAISVQVRSSDLMAAVLTVALAGLGVADVLYLNLRERSAELVTLRAVGWRDRDLMMLVLLEGVALGVLGSVAGGIAGFVLSVVILHVPAVPVMAAAWIAVAGGIAVAAGASLLPVSQLIRMTPATVLAEE